MWITKKWKKHPTGDEINKRFGALATEMFGDARGQEFLYLYKHMVRYDTNPMTLSGGDRPKADAHEGTKDAVRIIESAMQKHARNQTKENDGKTKES